MRQVLILADESADWIVAGLRQLERLLCALDESLREPAKVWVVWDPRLSSDRRWLPRERNFTQLEVCELDVTPEDKLPAVEIVLETRLFLYRQSGASESLLATMAQARAERRTYAQHLAALQITWERSRATDGWEYLTDAAQIPACEKRFLRGSGKSQDGLISRFINRPISRVMSRALLKTPVTPSAWTLSIFLLPLAGAAFLTRGDYTSVIVGLLFFQLYSILDGCDGEIARAKYIESRRGRQLDTWCDTLGNLLLVVGLGYGLSRQTAPSTFYFIESIIVAILIVTNELLLAAPAPSPKRADGALYPRHQQMVERSGLNFLGERFVWWLVQLTKRDVALLAFLFIAWAGRPAWILHLLGAVAAISSLLAVTSFARSKLAR
jgi:phosphatidylglycerophosphate synthase